MSVLARLAPICVYKLTEHPKRKPRHKQNNSRGYFGGFLVVWFTVKIYDDGLFGICFQLVLIFYRTDWNLLLSPRGGGGGGRREDSHIQNWWGASGVRKEPFRVLSLKMPTAGTFAFFMVLSQKNMTRKIYELFSGFSEVKMSQKNWNWRFDQFYWSSFDVQRWTSKHDSTILTTF